MNHLLRYRAQQQVFSGAQTTRTDDDTSATQRSGLLDDAIDRFSHTHMESPPYSVGIKDGARISRHSPAVLGQMGFGGLLAQPRLRIDKVQHRHTGLFGEAHGLGQRMQCVP